MIDPMPAMLARYAVTSIVAPEARPPSELLCRTCGLFAIEVHTNRRITPRGFDLLQTWACFRCSRRFDVSVSAHAEDR